MESGKTPSDSQITTLKSSLEQLQRKAEIIRDLDAKIVQATQDPSELEAEIFESEEIQDTIIKKTGSIKEFLSCHVQSGVPVKTRVTQTLDVSAQPFSTQHQDSLTSTDEPLPSNRSSTDSRPSVQIHDSATLSVSRLPKLNLPIFSGEPLSWQTFWDSFSATVDSNHSLSGVQKFNYLKAQIQLELLQVFPSPMQTRLIPLIFSRNDLDNHTRLSTLICRHYWICLTHQMI